MRRLRRYLAPTVAISIALVPSSALAASVVPPGNSAVNQYTQTFPTSGGDVAVHNKGISQPAKVLGPKAAHKLDRQGPEGQAAADLAAAGSPAPAPEAEASVPSNSEASGHQGSAEGHANQGGSSHAGGEDSAAQGASETTANGAAVAAANGSSGFGQVVGQATGSASSGELGLLMPLLLFGGLLWCVAYSVRKKHRAA